MYLRWVRTELMQCRPSSALQVGAWGAGDGDGLEIQGREEPEERHRDVSYGGFMALQIGTRTELVVRQEAPSETTFYAFELCPINSEEPVKNLSGRVWSGSWVQ